MECRFDLLVQKNFYDASKLYHGTTSTDAADIEKNGIKLYNCRSRTDFNGSTAFYVTADIDQARRWSRIKARKSLLSGAAIVEFEIDPAKLKMFKYKRFGTGEYEQWLEFTTSSRAGRDRDDEFDIVEGPYRTKAYDGKFTKPEGHQLGILSTVAAKYFDDHVIRKPRAVGTSSSSNDSVLSLLRAMRRLGFD